ncbi:MULTISPECIES: hypothetical protein [Caldimonas]|uniref:hypothetical protein n=1 Tax=Caldimonas TaxID=196013 RepID=UPI0003700DD4|nr:MULTISPECIES: hypothetical protein [Caldimonas]MCX7659201.1 hypothetical protein [Caldimonas manganoxidans]GIX23035.1 MAG: hypothetical protein KatS3mg122_0266 [Caldimonas sp.]
MDAQSRRLQIATRIHFTLLRELGSGIDVGLMLSRERYALDVLHVCRASENEELERLAEEFAQISRQHAAQAAHPARTASTRRGHRPWWRALGSVLRPTTAAAH